MEAPSYFNSQTNSTFSPNVFSIRFSQSCKSSIEYELSNEYILNSCVIVGKFFVTIPPTRCVGELTSKKIGFSSSNRFNSFNFKSNSKSEIVGLSKT